MCRYEIALLSRLPSPSSPLVLTTHNPPRLLPLFLFATQPQLILALLPPPKSIHRLDLEHRKQGSSREHEQRGRRAGGQEALHCCGQVQGKRRRSWRGSEGVERVEDTRARVPTARTRVHRLCSFDPLKREPACERREVVQKSLACGLSRMRLRPSLVGRSYAKREQKQRERARSHGHGVRALALRASPPTLLQEHQLFHFSHGTHQKFRVHMMGGNFLLQFFSPSAPIGSDRPPATSRPACHLCTLSDRVPFFLSLTLSFPRLPSP